MTPISVTGDLELKSRVKKVCEGYHASIYPCPESLVERREMLAGVEVRLEDLDRVLRETNDHRHGFLVPSCKM